MQKRVLDPCCGGRMMWLNKQNPDVVFGDRRSETIVVTDRSNGNKSGTRTLRIEPDTLIDFRALPYQDGSFKLVVFDPPHLVRAGDRSWLAAKYGKLSDTWQEDLRQGFAECFRVLDPDGVLVFKWNETQVKVAEVLALTRVFPRRKPRPLGRGKALPKANLVSVAVQRTAGEWRSEHRRKMRQSNSDSTGHFCGSGLRFPDSGSEAPAKTPP